MLYYSYKEKTKEYIGTGTAQPDPLESKKQGHEVWLLPKNATFSAPPEEKDGFARVWNGIEMKELGALPDGALLERPAKPQEQIEKERLEAAKAERAQAVQNIVVEVDGMVFDGNEDAQRRISVAITTANITGQQTVDWVLKNNTVAHVTRGQLEQVLALSMQKMQELWTLPYTE